jgi:glutathione synthase/RimK-type ligase-like ATP-grasp enzyme
MKIIAFVTSTAAPGIAADDTILRDALEARDLKVVAAAWDDPTVNWTNFDLLLIRSCWNYHLAPEKFERWISSVRSSKMKMVNPAELILWNLNKYYLKELDEKGVAVPDSVWIGEQDFYNDKLLDIVSEKKWDRAVLKPCVSASSFRTSVITPSTAKVEGEILSRNFPNGGMILQEFIEAIPQKGEVSMIFFNGAYSHAVVKEAMEGEFRVQTQYGGKTRIIPIDKGTLASAERIISKLSVVPLYARVDGFGDNGKFTLMELELIEPVLFLEYHPDAARKLAFELEKLL